jgi:hypothetical protein
MEPLKDKYQLAAHLGVKVGWVTRRITARTIPVTWIGRHARFSEEDIAEIKAQGKEAQPSPRLTVVRRGHPPAGPSTPPPPPGPKADVA